MICCYFFFFQAEDGIRDVAVTGVQTCALPISCDSGPSAGRLGGRSPWNSCATSRSMPGLRLPKSIPVRSAPLMAAPGTYGPDALLENVGIFRVSPDARSQ